MKPDFPGFPGMGWPLGAGASSGMVSILMDAPPLGPLALACLDYSPFSVPSLSAVLVEAALDIAAAAVQVEREIGAAVLELADGATVH